MANSLKNETQRKRWNDYNNNYAKKNYRTFCLKLNRTKDKELIDFLENNNENATAILKRLLRSEIEGLK